MRRTVAVVCISDVFPPIVHAEQFRAAVWIFRIIHNLPSTARKPETVYMDWAPLAGGPGDHAADGEEDGAVETTRSEDET